MAKTLGKVIGGGLNEGLRVLISNHENIEDFPVGSLTMIRGSKHRYLGIITDTSIQSAENTVRDIYGSRIDEDLKAVVLGALKDQIVDQIIEIALIGQASREVQKIADTIPSFYSDVVEVNPEDMKVFFGEENQKNLWNIGIPKTPKETGIYIPIDIEKLVELSFGIFGKSGTGKTFLGNILAGYMILFDSWKSSENKESKRLRLLIFDMHSEYSLELRDNLGNHIADGVAKIFSDRFLCYTPDLELAKNRGLRALRINYSDLTVDDLRLIAPIFGVSETFINHLDGFASALMDFPGSSESRERRLGKLWIWSLLINENVESIMEGNPEGVKILEEIKRKTGFESLKVLRDKILERIKERFGPSARASFLSQTSKLRPLLKYPYTAGESSINEIVENLVSEDGRSIVISMGRYEKETPLYMMIANLIARRLRDKILEKTAAGEELRTKIVIFLEEAHNFLGRETYRLSPFGEIAREMRKKGVTLCVIDQKPKELDDDVISMLWTNFVFTLTDRGDIESALMGMPKAELFAKVIPRLGRQEVLVHGEAISFPVVVRVMDYNLAANAFKKYRRLQHEKIAKRIRDIYEISEST